MHTNRWEGFQSEVFNIEAMESRVNADKLFLYFLLEVEKRKIDPYKVFTIEEINKLIPKGTAGIDNYATYGFSFMSMLSGQNYRDYFDYENMDLRDEFAERCKDSNRDNYYWRKNYLNEKCTINKKYIK
ncbi:MAG: hypothetical protein ACOXZT_08515 [Tissierellaceae bacterium]|jgi:hypothetical protein